MNFAGLLAHRSIVERYVAWSFASPAMWLVVALATLGHTLALAQYSPPPTSTEIPSPLDATTRRQVAEAFATALAAEYAHADVGQKMAQVIRAKLAADSYARITSSTEFAQALENDSRSVADDKHLRVSFNPRPPPGGPPSPAMVAQMRAQNGAIHKVQILAGNIGYLEVNGVPPLQMSKEAIAAAFAFVHNTAAVIIDVRGNGGGAPDAVAMYMSYLSEGAPYIVNTIHNRRGTVDEFRTTELHDLSYGAQKPVFCLTSARTFSGGEELAYDIKSFKRGVIVGETTGGGANPAVMRPLGHGFMAFLPNGYAVHPVTGTNWEGVGVKPDIAITAEQALLEAQRLAVDRIMAGASDPMDHAALFALLQDIQAQEISRETPGAAPNHLTATEVSGSYKSAGGPEPSITAKDGRLFLQFPSAAPPARLIPLGDDRYRLEGLPEDFTASFSKRAGTIQLFARLGGWPPILASRKTH